MRRSAAAILSAAALAVPLTFMGAETASAADTTQTATCTDGGGHVWKGRSTWSSRTYTEADGTSRIINNDVGFTSAASDTDTVDYTVTTYEGSGKVVRAVSKADLKFDFKDGDRYYTLDPRNPPTDPGRAKIVVTVGDGNDGKGDCSMTFTQPGGTTTTPPTSTPPTSTAVCKPGDEIVKFDGQGSAGLGQYGQGDYDASAELWGVGGYNYDQTMGVCTHDAWYVDVKTDNSKGDGAVKAYPSMRKIYHDWSTNDFSRDPLVSSFPRLAVTFGVNDPTTCPGCIYDTAFDIWLNGIGDGDANEVMIWTHNVGQRPYGDKVASGLKIAGHTWNLWSGGDNHYLAFEPTDTSNISSGTFDVKDFTAELVSRGRVKSDSRLGQISYGVETVSTNAVSRHWDFTKFTVADS